jgi:hypothetical protein
VSCCDNGKPDTRLPQLLNCVHVLVLCIWPCINPSILGRVFNVREVMIGAL